jgi:hypothetical protein
MRERSLQAGPSVTLLEYLIACAAQVVGDQIGDGWVLSDWMPGTINLSVTEC